MKVRLLHFQKDITIYPLGGFDNISVVAEVGKQYGEIYGTKFLRVTDATSPSFGKLLIDANGLPQADNGGSKFREPTSKRDAWFNEYLCL